MSETPRTDEEAQRIILEGELYDITLIPLDFARQLERELAAALKRVKRLEEAGSEALDYAADSNWLRAVAVWEAAKEAKP